ncbi:MAG: sugar ABC transporter substrate-binding protein [Clostridiales bacterium]|nr:sugar ABC transporter substrate-binding protein [Clostridiales bacterium]
MKKITAILVTMLLVLSMVGCGGTTQSATQGSQAATLATSDAAAASTDSGAAPQAGNTGKKDIIALCLPTLDNPLMVEFKDSFNAVFGADYQLEVASANNDAKTQATQVENYVTMNPKLIAINAIETTTLVPTIEAARKKGIKVIFVGTNPGPDVADVVMSTNNFMGGEMCALMTKDWVDKTYASAAPGSVSAAILVSTRSPDDVDRSNGLRMVTEEWCKNSQGSLVGKDGNPISEKDGKYLAGKSDADRVANPAYSKQLKVVSEYEAAMFADAQTAMDNILTKYPDVKVVLCYSSNGGDGASQTIMDGIKKGIYKDKPENYGVFGVGLFGPELDLVKKSNSNESLLRGCVSFGGTELTKTVAENALKLVKGEKLDAFIWDKLFLVTPIMKEGQPDALFTEQQSGGVLGTGTK